jgi:shikimate 5-dehydrogenase
MYFIGVSTARSMIMQVFPEWKRHLALGDCRITGIDLLPHDATERYRHVVRFIKDDPLSLGALVTTHKIDLLRATADMFDELDHFALLMGEVSAISKREGKLIGGAKDALTSGLALEAFLPPGHWERTGADAFIMGAGGSSIALSSYLLGGDHQRRGPHRVVVTNRTEQRLHEIMQIHSRQGIESRVEYVHSPLPSDNDAVMSGLSSGSLVVNATGLGKDGPGSPITDNAVFPADGFAWDFNYRGELRFLHQARAQAKAQHLHVEDGWLYFIYGWLSVIGDVFHREIPSSGPGFLELCGVASQRRTNAGS